MLMGGGGGDAFFPMPTHRSRKIDGRWRWRRFLSDANASFPMPTLPFRCQRTDQGKPSDPRNRNTARYIRNESESSGIEESIILEPSLLFVGDIVTHVGRSRNEMTEHQVRHCVSEKCAYAMTMWFFISSEGLTLIVTNSHNEQNEEHSRGDLGSLAT